MDIKNNLIVGKNDANNMRIGIVISEFNKLITEALLDGATDAFVQMDGNPDDLMHVRVPGAFELAGTVNQLIEQVTFDAVITLGAVVRGGTPHFDFVAGAAASNIAELACSSPVPIIFGVLTTDDFNSALERSANKAGNKGWEVMEAAVRMAWVYRQIRG